MTGFMNNLERFIVHNRLRWYLQRWYEIPILQQLGFDVRGKHVLEVGCGTGRAAWELVTRYGANSVHAIDVDIQVVTGAFRRYHHPQILFTVADATMLPFPADTFDVVLGFGLLHHVPDWQAAVEEVARVLRPGGAYALDDFVRSGLEKPYHQVFDHPRENRFSSGDLVRCLHANRIDVVDVTHRLAGDVVFLRGTKR